MSNFPTCEVCQQHFSLKGPAPFLLPCLHCVCEICVTSAAEGVISCSTCQKDVNLTETRLLKDVITEKEILQMTVIHHPELVLCTYDEDGNQAVCWCKECEDFLCEHCQMIHGRPKISRHHVVEDIGDLQPGSFDTDTYCKIHPKFILDKWDEQCCILICRKCKDGEHSDHKTVDFDEVFENAKRELADLEKELKSSFTQKESLLATLDTDLQTSDETFENLIQKISHTFNPLKTVIDQREKELQIELQRHQETVRRELNEKKNTSEACQKKCQTTSEYISKALLYSSRHDIMSLRHIMQSKTVECISSAQAIIYESPSLPKFSTDGLDEIKSVLAGFGRLASANKPIKKKQTNDCATQTEDLLPKECEKLKQKLQHLKMTHDKEIQLLRNTLTEVKEEEKKGLYRLKADVANDSFLLKCTCVEFSIIRFNAQYVKIIKGNELINTEVTDPSCREWQLKKYKGTRGHAILPKCGSPKYFEVRAKLGKDKTMTGKHLLEIALAREEEHDQHHWIAECPTSYSLTVSRCSRHSSICKQVWQHGKHLLCLPDTLENTFGNSASLHFGVVYDNVRSRIAFLDVKSEKIIGKIDNVDSSADIVPMFGVDNLKMGSVIMSLVVGHDIDLTENKKALLIQSLL